MDSHKQGLKGSPHRDAFKQKHKELCSYFYATDLDLVFVSKSPPGIVAGVDYKKPGERVTFSEVLAYNDFLSIAPLYIIRGADPECGPFAVTQYMGGDWKPEPPSVNEVFVCECVDWPAFEGWEASLRRKHSEHG